MINQDSNIRFSKQLKLALAVFFLILFFTYFSQNAQNDRLSPSDEARQEIALSKDLEPQLRENLEKKAERARSLSESEEFERKLESSKISRVIDGDTVELEDGRRLRYIGVDAPETVHPSRSVECFGKEASQKNKDLVEGKQVFLEKDVSETDRYGRLLRYVWLDGEMINEKLVLQGYAVASSYPPDVKYQEKFVQAQRKAQQNSLGLWDACVLEDAGEVAGAETTQASLETNSEDCLIKGNISYSSGEKIYHLPNCPNYNSTVIIESQGERWFCSEQEAQAAGWRRAKNCL